MSGTATLELARTPWHPRLTSPWAAGLVLVFFYAALLLSLRGKSATFDEPGHATAGYVYWKFGDYRIDPENGNLSKRWIALPFLFSGERFPPIAVDGWLDSNSWRLADAWFNRVGNDTTAMLARGRAMSGLVAVALGLVVWLWSRHLFGPLGGMISLLLFVFSPTLLANGGLMTSDTPAALGFLLSLACIWMTLERISVARVAMATVAIAGLFLAKMSAVLVLPMAGLLVLVRIIDGRPLRLGATRLLTRRTRQAAAIGMIALVQTMGIFAIVWAFYGFRYDAFSPAGPSPRQFHHPWQWVLTLPSPRNLIDQLELNPSQRAELDPLLARRDGVEPEWSYPLLDDLEKIRNRVLTSEQAAKLEQLMRQPPPQWAPRLIHMAREHRLLPEAFLYGYAHVWRTSGRLAAFFNGEISDRGWRSFFPFTFLVKTPLALFGLMGIVAVTALAVWRKDAALRGSSIGRVVWSGIYGAWPLLILIVVYGAFAISANLNIGHRHLLPLYPPIFVLGGGAAYWFSRHEAGPFFPRGRQYVRAAVSGLVLLLAGDVGLRFPNYLAYFNGLVAPANAYRHLVDSSLDWGQELPAIARYLGRHPNERAYLAFFGVGSPASYGIKAQPIGGFPALDWKLFPPLKPLPGASNAELVTFLQEHPQYDGDLVFRLDGAATPAVLMIQRSSAHRLAAGLYVISASMLQPLYCGKVNGYWNPELEDGYQQLKRAVQPFLSDDRDAKMAAMPTRSIQEWMSIFDDYYDFRLARLTSYLRTRAPDDTINFSVLVYRLSDADIARALDGPPYRME